MNIDDVLNDVIEEEREMMEMLMAVSNLGVAVVMDMEEGYNQGFIVWEKVTVNIDEYRLMSNPCFGLHFRMTREVFEELVNEVGNHLVHMGRWRRNRTSLTVIMLMVVWILATPDSFRSIALRFGVTPGVLHFHYTYIIEALRELAPQYIKWPTENERDEIKTSFQRASGFPGVVGCIDCTHVYVTKPVFQGERYVNRHQSYSLTTQAVVDNTLLVRDLYVGEAGSLHDSRTFRRSPLFPSLIEDERNSFLQIDEHLLGDGAYTLTHYLLTPFENNGHRTERQLQFNKKLSQCRVRVENAFGRAKGKWRRLKFLHAMDQRNVVDHISASFVLHNFTILHGEHLFDEEELAEPLRNNDGHDDEEVNEDGGGVAAGNEHPLLAQAKRRGIEKRQFIMNYVLPQAED